MPEHTSSYAPAFSILSGSPLRAKASVYFSFLSTPQEVLQYCRGSTRVLIGKYWSTAVEVLKRPSNRP